MAEYRIKDGTRSWSNKILKAKMKLGTLLL